LSAHVCPDFATRIFLNRRDAVAEANYLPYQYVNYLRNPGLSFSGGTVALDAYMCKTISNGGNDSADSLLGQLRWMRDGGTGPTLNALVGGNLIDEAWKGQGQPSTFVAIWDFMCRNKERLKKLKVEACGRRMASNGYAKNVLKTGNVYDLYFKDHTDQQAIERMIDDRFFGIDCVGFAAGVLLYNGEWTKYQGGEPLQWAKWFCAEKVQHATDILPLDFLIWDGHIAMIDWVWRMVDDKTVEVDICQSSAGGPQCNERVILQETGQLATGDHRKFKFYAAGTPAAPVQGFPFVMRRKGFFW
jgi:hypothetical protein